MKFGLLTQWYDPEPGPAGLPGALARGLVANGHSVEVLTGFPNYPQGRLADGYRIRPRQVEMLDGVRVTRTALYPAHGNSTVKRMLNYGTFGLSAGLLGVRHAFRGIDALWVNYSPPTVALPMLIQHRLRRTPSVVHVLDLWPDTLTATGFTGERGLAARTANALLYRTCSAMYNAANHVAYISPGVGQALSARGVAPEKLAYAPMWANEALLTKPFDEISATSPDSANVTLLYAGSLGRAQGLDTLIRSAARLRHLPLTCLIAGSGTEEQALRDLAVKCEATNVTFLGRVPEAEVPVLIAKADVNYISLNDDPLARITMPSKVQAILAAGGPIVGALPGDAAATIEESGAGWVCSPNDADALEVVLRHVIAEGRERIAVRRDAARNYYAREFSWSKGVQRIEALLVGAAEGRL